MRLAVGVHRGLFFLGHFIQAQFLGLLLADQLVHIGVDHLAGNGGRVGGVVIGNAVIGGVDLIIRFIHGNLVLHRGADHGLGDRFAVYIHDHAGVILRRIYGHQRAAAQQHHERQQ